MKEKPKQEQTLNKFGEPSYQSPQSAIMGKMGVALPRQAPDPEPMPMMWAFAGKKKRKGKKY